MIERKLVNIDEESQILTYCIISTSYLERFIQLYKSELFQLDYSKIIFKWCVEYYNTYKETPKEIIKDIFKSKKELNEIHDSMADLIERFIDQLFEKEYTIPNNISYLIDQAEKYLKKQNLKNKLSLAKTLLTEDKIEDAENVIYTYSTIKKQVTIGVNPFINTNFVRGLFKKEDNEKNLFQFHGDFGKFFGIAKRRQFIAFAAPEKRGKSYWLMELMGKALFSGLSVAVFHFEMDKDEYTERYLRWLTGKSADNDIIRIPVFDCRYNQVNECTLRERVNHIPLMKKNEKHKPEFEFSNKNYVPCDVCRGRKNYLMEFWWKEEKKGILTEDYAVKKLQAAQKQIIRGDKVRILDLPSESVNMNDIDHQLTQWEKEEHFIADFVITDHADLIASTEHHKEKRHRIDNVWDGHKRLAKRRNILVASASHTNRETLEKDIKQTSLAEDKRKASHTDLFISINQSDDEKEQGIQRMSVFFGRHKYFNAKHQCYVLQNLDIGRPNLDSYIPFKTNLIKEK